MITVVIAICTTICICTLSHYAYKFSLAVLEKLAGGGGGMPVFMGMPKMPGMPGMEEKEEKRRKDDR